jgi:hypothetical protein
MFKPIPAPIENGHFNKIKGSLPSGKEPLHVLNNKFIGLNSLVKSLIHYLQNPQYNQACHANHMK